MRFDSFPFWTFAILVVSGVRCWAAGPFSEMAVGDWYFRESLIAIDDWETILADRETEVAEADRIPVFPVPVHGDTVAWPNPIPQSLLPSGTGANSVRLQLDGDSIAVFTGDAQNEPKKRQVQAGETVRGAQHPGGGGKSQWYHRYDRRFDALLALRPQPAPFALELAERWNPRFGKNRLTVILRNTGTSPSKLHLRCHFRERCLSSEEQSTQPTWRRGEQIQQRILTDRLIELDAGKVVSTPLAFDLSRPGGGLMLIEIATESQTYWFALLTHVEDVPGVLRSVEQIVSDTADAQGSLQLAELRLRMNRLLGDTTATASDSWSELFLAASALRDQLLLDQIDFERLLFVKRKPYISEQPFMDGHHCYNRPGGGIYSLSPVSPEGAVTTVVDSLGTGIYRDVCLHWGGQRLLFAFGNGSDRPRPLPDQPLDLVTGDENYNIYEIAIDGTQLRQVTASPYNDCEPFYLPNGQIGFTSDRAEHVVMCGSDIHVASLHTMHADGSAVQQLGFNVFNEFNPSVLPDGRIIYNRWEYNERSVTSLHDLFTIHPDGSHAAPFYGNATIRPNVIMFPRPVPDSHKVMALFTGHHGQTHGPIGTIDVGRGVDGPEPVTVLTPGVPVIGEKIEDSRHGWYSEPWPLSETTYLCSFTPTVQPWLEQSWALYVGDRHGNLGLVYRDANISCAEPVPLISRATPDVLSPARPNSDADQADASLLVLDVYRGLSDTPRGTARYLRVLEDVPRKAVPTGGVICTSGTQIYTVKRVWGTVPIESDGSAHFSVPANRNVYFQVLDEARREIQRMRSVVCLKPGESRTCVGCHEPRTQSPPNGLSLASLRPPDRPVPPPWGTEAVSFLRDVQPLVSEKCAQCHSQDRAKCRVLLTDDLTDQFTVAYEELLPYLSVANAMRWDNPEDVYPRPAYTYGSNASPLVKLLTAGHHGVSLTDDQWERLTTWIDTNGVYYDRYETYYPNRQIFTGPVEKQMHDVYARRCAACHGEKNDGRFSNWWRSVDQHDVQKSRMLQAPLAGTAGGWQRCQPIVFADQSDPDYQTLVATLTRLHDQLRERPRADLLSVRDSIAERQDGKRPRRSPSRNAPDDDL
jgi:hypothetical protein